MLTCGTKVNPKSACLQPPPTLFPSSESTPSRSREESVERSPSNVDRQLSAPLLSPHKSNRKSCLVAKHPGDKAPSRGGNKHPTFSSDVERGVPVVNLG